MYVFRELTDLSYPAIAREFGGRDHTTVIHAVEKISALMKERRQIYDQVTELIQADPDRELSRAVHRRRGHLCTATSGQRCGRPADDARRGGQPWRSSAAAAGPPCQPVGRWGSSPATATCLLTCAERSGCPQSTALTTVTTPIDHHIRDDDRKRAPAVKFRCERDVLVEALGTAGRAVVDRGGSLPVLSGVRLELTGDHAARSPAATST